MFLFNIFVSLLNFLRLVSTNLSLLHRGPSSSGAYTSRRVIAQARAESLKRGINPLLDAPVYGSNPYRSVSRGISRPDPAIHSLPPLLEHVPPLPQLDITVQDLILLQVLRDDHEEECVSCVYKVRYRGDAYILKVYRGSGDPNRTDRFRLNDGQFRFHNEKHAYEHLLHFGVCAKGFVPHCYGWFTLPDFQDTPWLHPFASDSKPPDAILLQYFEGAVKLDVTNITVDIAEQALTAMSYIHDARIIHCDAYPRNHLVLPNGRVVIIDFDAALTRPHKKVNRLELTKEMSCCWGLYYRIMLPDRLLGLTPEQATLF
ncbi:hypothetical protein JAAARDRAFT_198257 [Jaapia argillacea MUCL 33604]|uniref:Protein kinase domain-containing protein n=1 Tax=Jaapia argillacea MUCL 33604 TaxID=933084 RepID=A0A067PC38_9AGAM|nr:hypothetical protein JAAARDRAFT_198257 [Jaapia argillacea MUCL 33604]